MAEPYTIPPGAGRPLDLGTFEAVVLADASQTDGEFSLLRTQREPMGFGPPMHLHHDAAEAFYVLEGTYAMFSATAGRSARPGPSSTCRAARRTPSRSCRRSRA
jgi:mannose-6-phosphate isomerase-like protein (cupin superfamily)